MKRDSIVDYLSCILARLLGPIIRILPLNFSLFLGRRLGELLYYFDLKHKTIAYSNLKVALGFRLSPLALSNITKEFYRNFGQSLIEIFFIPLVNKEYVDKYISIEGKEYISEAFRKGKGVILLSVHAGSWELSNIICSVLGCPFSLLIRDQRLPRLDKLLGSYRSQKGCKIIQRKNQTRQLIDALKRNEAVGMTVDQGGKTGTLVKFFGRDASMATGAVRLALKYDAAIIPGFYVRINGPYIKILLGPPFEIKKTGNRKKDINENLQRIVSIFERYITDYPADYLWYYKIWKYTKEKKILILSDGKTGHLRQAQALAKILNKYLNEKKISSHADTVEVKFKNSFSRRALTFSCCLAGRYHCQGCLWCLRAFLKEENYNSLIKEKPDFIISCGSSLSPVSYILSRENLAKSIAIMRPSILSTRRFDLVVMPMHDRPLKRNNVAVTEGALSLIDEEYLKEQSQELNSQFQVISSEFDFYIGLLIGGDTKNFHLGLEMMQEVIRQAKSVCEKFNAGILVTTSRRTCEEIENLARKEFKNYSRSRLLIIANENNVAETVGGILGLSRITIVSPESISMISEACAAGRYIIVFKSKIDSRHDLFLKYMSRKGYIYLCDASEIFAVINNIRKSSPAINKLRDYETVRGKLEKIL